jgi:hypothetical protein
MFYIDVDNHLCRVTAAPLECLISRYVGKMFFIGVTIYVTGDAL